MKRAALWELGRAADGSMRDALSLTDQAIGFGNGKINEQEVRQMLGSIDQQYVIQLVEALIAQQAAKVFEKQSRHWLSTTPITPMHLDELLSLLHHIAIQQAIPNYQHPDLINNDAIQKLAAQIPAEDIQLYYQVGINGQRDLSLAPDPRKGFEMTLLRMLAFKPQNAPQLSKTSTQVSPQMTPQTTPQAAPQTTPQVAAGNTAKKLHPAPTAPVEVTLHNLSADNWHLMFEQLGLSGVIHNIANHCILNAMQKNPTIVCQMHFTLDEKQAALFNNSHQERLATYLSQKFSCPISITITVAAVHRETPSAIQLRLQQERQAAAEQLFVNDPHVKNILDYFDGTLLSDSIKPIHH